LLGYYYVKIIFTNLPFSSVSVTCLVFLFTMIINIGVSRYGNLCDLADDRDGAV